MIAVLQDQRHGFDHLLFLYFIFIILKFDTMVNTPTNKVALVTAGSAGLGAAIASTLAAWGARVVINYSQNRERAEALVEKLSQSFPTPVVEDGGKRFVAIQADMGNRTDISRLVDETIATMGRLDIVISNSGWTRLTDFKNLDAGVEEADWDRCFFMNVKCHLFLMHASRKYLDEAEGVFITTASLAGVKPSGSSLVSISSTFPIACPWVVLTTTKFKQAYAVTKAAQIHLVKSLATIVSPKIRVNSVSPGILLTVCQIGSCCFYSYFLGLTILVGLGAAVFHRKIERRQGTLSATEARHGRGMTFSTYVVSLC